MTEEKSEEIREVRRTVKLDAPVERVWKAITDANELVRWFPLEARVEPGEGGRMVLAWREEFEFEELVERWEPPFHLRTVSASMAPTIVTEYRLIREEGRTLLTVVTSGFPEDASWDEMVDGTRRGWTFELEQLRHYLGRHDGMDRTVVWLRRSVDCPPADALRRLLGTQLVERLGANVSEELGDDARQWFGGTSDPAEGFLRLSVDPVGEDGRSTRVSLWLSAWEPCPDNTVLEQPLRQALEVAFPSGEKGVLRR